MNGSNTFTFNRRARAFVLACSLAFMALLVTGTVPAWAQDMQDMQDMPATPNNEGMGQQP